MRINRWTIRCRRKAMGAAAFLQEVLQGLVHGPTVLLPAKRLRLPSTSGPSVLNW